MATNGDKPQRCWVTLLTQSSYLPGVITLAYSLYLTKSKFPLVVLVTPSVPVSCLQALRLEAAHNELLHTRQVEPLVPWDGEGTAEVAQRFEDTWTKLRAFELTSYETCVFLDADITIYENIDELMNFNLPDSDWIAACHACVCNLDHDPWAPDNWNRRNCAYTPLRHPSSLQQATPTPRDEGPPHTHALLNGGTFLYHPSQILWDQLLDYFTTCPVLHDFKFPDQDFLAAFFVHKWVPLSWKYNALKTMRQWHPNIWRDKEVKALHYIVDKPWQRRIASDGIAGYLGRDGETHSRWWKIYLKWRSVRLGPVDVQGRPVERRERLERLELVEILDDIVAPELIDEEDRKQCKENIRKGFPIPVSTDQRLKEN